MITAQGLYLHLSKRAIDGD